VKPGDDLEEDESAVEYATVAKRIILLFDTGRLYMIDISLNSSGGLDCEGDISIEYGEGLSFPIAGVRRFSGTNPEPAGSTSKSLGEGSCLVYMQQSGILLYKCVTSAMVAFTLNEHGEIVGNFEFLPHLIKSAVFDQSESDSITGPYTNWIELGIADGDTSSFHRAAFVGRSTRTNQPHLMYIEYNHECSKVKKMKMPGNVNLTLSMITSYEGLAAFSGPVVIGNPADSGLLGQHGSFFERVYLVSLTSNGILTFHGEHLNTGNSGITKTSILSNRRRALSESGIRKEISTERVKFKDLTSAPKPLPSFPFTVFETLTNVTRADELIFGGDGVDENSTVTKRKLCTGSNEYVVSPSKEGCTFIVSLQRVSAPTKDKDDGKLSIHDPAKHAIVAIRILLGTNTTDFLPREVSVMGRSIKPTRDKKRWYDVPLTDEEIMLGVRAGFVSICISGALDGDKNQALIDAIEVYAEKRASIPHLFPIVSEKNPNETLLSTSLQGGAEGSRKSLDTCIVVISHIFQLMGGASGLSSSISEDSLQRLIQVTALDSDKEGSVRNHVIELLKELESDPHAMQMLLDKGSLQGICNVLKDLESVTTDIINTTTSGKEDEELNTSESIPDHLSEKILMKVNECLLAATAIVKERPGNYKNAIESLITSNNTRSSIALHSKTFIEKCQVCTTVAETASRLVELTIHETMSNSDDQMSKSTQSFAGLETLAGILGSPNQSIVQKCCETVAKVLKDLQEAQVLLQFRCDCCGILPITKMRFTMDEEGYDIDLCQDCYNKGKSHALLKSYSPAIPVLVDKKPIHISRHDRDLSCAEICQMSSKTVPEIPIDNFQDQGSNRASIPDPERVDDDDDDEVQLRIALKMSLEEAQEEPADASTSTALRTVIFKNLLDGVIHNLSATEYSNKSNILPVVNLLLTLVLQCSKVEDRVELGQKMCEALCHEISTLTELCTNEETSKAIAKRSRYAIVLYLRSLTCLMTKKDNISTAPLTSTANTDVEKIDGQLPPVPASKSKTDPRFVCESHGVAAVRRR